MGIYLDQVTHFYSTFKILKLLDLFKHKVAKIVFRLFQNHLFPNYLPSYKKSETDTLSYFYPTYLKSEKKIIIYRLLWQRHNVAARQHYK